MIEREFVEQKKKEFQIQEFVSETLKNAGHSHTKLQRTPLGEKVVIYTSRPGLIVGRKGQTISRLTEVLKRKFGLENPQVEIAEVSNPNLDARIVAERIASELERFGSNRFKGIMHRIVEDVLASGAVGVEVRLSGKLPSARAKHWRVAGGYLRKCGDAAITYVATAIMSAQLKSGIIGIQVRIMPPGIVMPDEIRIVAAASAESGKVVSGPVAHEVEPSESVIVESVAEEGVGEGKDIQKEKLVEKSATKKKSASAQTVPKQKTAGKKAVKSKEGKEGKPEVENESSERH